MKKYLIAFSLCLLLVLAASPAHAADSALKNVIENRYRDLRMAIAKGDPDMYRGNLASDFSSVDLADNARNADQIIAALGQTVPDDSRKENTTVNSLKLDGDKAVVEQTYDLTALRVAQDNRKIPHGDKIHRHMGQGQG
jgi:hypothetical protein